MLAHIHRRRKISQALSALASGLMLVTVVQPVVGQQSDRSDGDVGAVDWSFVVDSLVRTIEAVHPDPYRHVLRATFAAAAADLRANGGGLRPEVATARLLRLVALLGDGHTTLEPGAEVGYDRWFPVRFYRFSDGLYVTTVDSALAYVAGKRVVRIGTLAADSAFAAASALVAGDNDFGRMESAAVHLSSAPFLVGIGAIDEPAALALTVRDGARDTSVVLASIRSTDTMDWRFWGEMFGPPPSLEDRRGNAYTTAFGGRGPMDYRSSDSDLPRHLRYRLYYWFDPLPDLNAMYVQWNFVLNDPEEALTAFRERMWAAYDEAGADRLILDLRYNSGGDGSMLLPFVHDVICREEFRQPGGLVVLLGRKTFSASVMLMAELDKHLPVVFVGEPAGAAKSHFGDATTIDLPAGIRLKVSTLDWRLGHPTDTLHYQPIQVPAPFSGGDYFAGVDPALTAISAGEAEPLASTIIAGAPRDSVLGLYGDRARRYRRYPWWEPFPEAEMNSLGYSLLGEGRLDHALTAFELNTLQYPESWNTWDSFGDGLAKAGRQDGARAAYRRALEQNPTSSVTREKFEALRDDGGE